MVRVFISYRNNTLDIRCAIQQLILRSFQRYIFLTASMYTRFLRSHLLPNLSFPSLSFARPEMTKGKTKAVGNRGSRNAEMDDTRNRATLEEGSPPAAPSWTHLSCQRPKILRGNEHVGEDNGLGV